MRRTAAAFAAIAGLLLAAPQSSTKKSAAKTASAPKKTTVAKKAAPKKTSARKRRPVRRRATTARRRPSIPSMPRKTAVLHVSNALNAGEALNGSFEPFHNAAALIPFFERLYRLKNESGPPVHVLQYGDSHTASDGWPSVLRQSFQARFGNGGAGYAVPGRYKRYDFSIATSRGWTTTKRGDGMHGLGGVSITAEKFGETITLQSAAEQAELFFLQQPGGGNLDIWLGDQYQGTVATDGELKPMAVSLPGEPGPRRYLLRTATAQPVRLLGFLFQNSQGVTWETLGINGASAAVITEWDESALAPHLTARDPALIVLAYGTNEANTRAFDAASYETTMRAALTRIRRLTPAASILVVGPPDFRSRAPGMLDKAVEVQQRVALEFRCAFWDWRARMGGDGAIRSWYFAGYAQRDLIHFTPAGYQLVGKTLYEDLILMYERFLTARSEAVNVAAREDQ